MKMNESKGNQIAGLFFMIFGLVIAFVIIPMEIADVGDSIISARFFPRVFAIIMAAIGLLLFLEGCREKNKPNQAEFGVSLKGIKLILITFLILIGYVLLLYVLPYIAATIPVLALMIWIYGQRNVVKIAAVSVAVPLIIYLAFTYLLKLVLP